MEAVTNCFRKYWGVLVQSYGFGMYVVKNEAGEYVGERSRFLVQLEYNGVRFGPGDIHVDILEMV